MLDRIIVAARGRIAAATVFPPRLPAGRCRRRRRPAAERRPAGAVGGATAEAATRTASRPTPSSASTRDGAGDPDHAPGRDGAGHLHLDADADRRGARGRRSTQVAARACAARTTSSTATRCSACQVTGGSTSVRGVWEPLRQAGATARDHAGRGGGAALERRSGDLPRRERRGASTPPTGRSARLRRAAPKPPRSCRCPRSVALKDPKDFTLIGTPAKRLDTPDKVNGTARLRHRRAAAGHEDRDGGAIARCSAASSPRVDDSDGARRSRACARSCGSTMPSPWSPTTWGPRRRAWRRSAIEWDDGPQRRARHRATSCDAARAGDARSRGAVAQQRWRCRQGAWRAPRRRVEAVYQLPFLAHADDGADELHGARAPGRLRRLGRHAGPRRARRRRPRKVTGLPLEQGRASTTTCSAAASAAGSRSTASPRRCRSPSRSTAR